MILANDFKRQWADIGPDVLRAVERVGESGWLILGQEVRRFESALAAAWGLPFASGVASGLDAIEISLRVLGCRPGDRVITTPISAFATTLAIAKLGATPVFVDCDDRGLIRLDLVEKALADKAAGFLVPVHLYGFCLDLDHLKHLRERYEVRIVEDCAQSILATWSGRPTGSAGQMAATSFYPTKNLGAMGDGGAVLGEDRRLIDEVAFYRDYGQTEKYRHARLGYNSRLDELQAAILHAAMLPRLAGWTARRRKIARDFREGIQNPKLRLPREDTGEAPCYHLFPVFTDPEHKADFIGHLRRSGVAAGEHYPLSILEQEALLGVPFEIVGECTQAARLCRSEVSLPVHPYLTDAEAAAIIAACNAWSG